MLSQFGNLSPSPNPSPSPSHHRWLTDGLIIEARSVEILAGSAWITPVTLSEHETRQKILVIEGVTGWHTRDLRVRHDRQATEILFLLRPSRAAERTWSWLTGDGVEDMICEPARPTRNLKQVWIWRMRTWWVNHCNERKIGAGRVL